MPVSPLELTYERAMPWYAHKRAFYLVLFLLLLNVVATTSISWGPPAVQSLRDSIVARRAAAQQAQLNAARAARQAQLNAASVAAASARALQLQAAFARCLQFDLPPGQLIYTDDPQQAGALLARRSSAEGPSYSTVPTNDTGRARAHCLSWLRRTPRYVRSLPHWARQKDP